MKKTNINLVPNAVNPSPDYYCTWQTQLFATCDGKPERQRAAICEKALFDTEKPYGWAYFYEQARKDLLFVMDDSWDVPPDGNSAFYGSLLLNAEKFPQATSGAKTNAQSLKKLTERIKSLGWKGLGGWVCAGESEMLKGENTQKEYWIKRLKEANEADFAYWKVDWGVNEKNEEFRKMQTALAKKYAPNLIIEHAMVTDIIPHSDVFRTYDVPAIMSIPMTMQKLGDILSKGYIKSDALGLIDCEDEAYIAAAGGFSMGIMRHPYVGAFSDGRADMSFPEIHRKLKTKMFEVIRAARWHRIAPAFGVDGKAKIDENNLTDTWDFVNREEEIEEWWFNTPIFAKHMEKNTVKIAAPAQIVRNCEFAQVESNGKVPYIVASKNPNGVFSVATLGRTYGRTYEIPKCRITIKTDAADTVGVFGNYDELVIKTELKNIKNVLMQDIAEDNAYDITEGVKFENGTVVICGEDIYKIGTSAQPTEDTSEPGVVIKFK